MPPHPERPSLINRFSHEHLPLVLYVPAGFLGHLSIQYFLARFVSPIDRKQLEKHHYHAQMIFSTAQMLALQALRIRSAYIFAAITSFMLTGVAVRGVVGKGVYKYVPPTLLLVAGLVEAVTSVSLVYPIIEDLRLNFVDARHLHTPHWSNG